MLVIDMHLGKLYKLIFSPHQLSLNYFQLLFLLHTISKLLSVSQHGYPLTMRGAQSLVKILCLV